MVKLLSYWIGGGAVGWGSVNTAFNLWNQRGIDAIESTVLFGLGVLLYLCASQVEFD